MPHRNGSTSPFPPERNRRSASRRRAAAGAGLLLAALSACAPADGPAGGADSVVLSLTAEPKTLNFVLANDGSAKRIGQLVADGLVDHDDKLEFVPQLATSWTVSDDERTITFHLRRGVRWHDGTPFTADDVRFTYERIVDPESGSLSKRSQFLAVERLETPDPHTVRVVYARPFAAALLAWEVPILPRHAFGEGGFRNSPRNRRPIGTGPYRFAEWRAAQEIVLEANDDYWRGPPPFRRVIFRFIPSLATQYQALLAGGIDLCVLTPEHWQDLEARPERERFRIFLNPRLYVAYLAWNGAGDFAPFRDPRVRRALTHLIDRKSYTEKVLHGLGDPAASVFHPSSFAYDPGLAPLPHDPAEADRLLRQAGWPRPAGGGLRRRAGEEFRFSLLIAGGIDWQERFAAYLQESYREAGIGVDIRRVESGVLSATLRNGRYQAAVSGFGLDIDPDPFPILHSSQIGTGSNFVGYRNPEADRLLERAREALDPEVRGGIYRELARLLARDQPYTFLWFRSAPLAVNARIENVRGSPLGYLLWYPGLLDWRPAAGYRRAAPAP